MFKKNMPLKKFIYILLATFKKCFSNWFIDYLTINIQVLTLTSFIVTKKKTKLLHFKNYGDGYEYEDFILNSTI